MIEAKNQVCGRPRSIDLERNGGGRRRAWRAIAVCLAAATAGCNRDRHPVAFLAGADSVAFVEVAPPPPELSRFDVPLRYDFTPVLAVVERVIPLTFGSLDSVRRVGDDDRKHYAFEATRGPFTAFATGSQIALRATLSYSARGFYKPLVGPTIGAGCGKGDDRPRIVVELVTPLTLSRTWHLQSAAQLAQLAPASDSARDHCVVSILHYDVTNRVVDAAREGLVKHLRDIDDKVAAVDLTGQATKWWDLLNRPIRLTDGVWLMLDPQQLRIGDVSGEGHTLTVQAGLDAQPRIVTGAEPHFAPRPLPPVKYDTTRSRFSITLEGYVDYITASAAITEALRGRTLTEGGRSVNVQSVLVSPAAAGKMALAVAFTGDASGTLRFIGTPQYDPVRGMIIASDLQYDLKTDDHLINAYAWLRSDALLTLFREKAAVPVAPVVERGRALLLSGLNRTIGGTMTLTATVDSVAVYALYVTRQGLMVRAGASGKAHVSVRGK